MEGNGVGNDVLSVRQMMVLLAVALLSPVTDLLPTLVTRTSGNTGWAAALIALPLLLAALWAAGGGFWQNTGGRTAMSIPIIIVYLLWTLMSLSLSLRLCGARLAVIYGEGPAFACALALLVLAAWMCLGKSAAFARAAEIFYLALAVALILVLALAADKIEWENLSPETGALTGLPVAGITTAGVLLNIAPVAVLSGRIAHPEQGRRRVVGWTVAFCLAAALALAAVVGCLGPKLTGRLPAPFLTMVQGLGVKGAFQRTEALFAALWTLSDLVRVGLLLHAWRALAQTLRPGKWCRWSVLPAAGIALLGGWLFFSNVESARYFCMTILPVTGLFFGLFVPLILRFATHKAKRQ